MKRVIFLFVVLVMCILNALAGDTPASVESAFANKFPKAEGIKWTKLNTGNYKAAFKVNGFTMSAIFALEGKWKETETSIPVKELPKGVTGYLSENYPKTKVTEAAKIERPDMDAVFFKVGNGKDFSLILTVEGKVVR